MFHLFCRYTGHVVMTRYLCFSLLHATVCCHIVWYDRYGIADKLCSSSYNFPCTPVTSYLLSPNLLLSKSEISLVYVHQSKCDTKKVY